MPGLPTGEVPEFEPCGVMRRTNHAHQQHSVVADIIAERLGSKDLGFSVQPRDPGTDRSAGIGYRRCRWRPGCVQGGLDDLGIAGAPAEHAGQSFADTVARRRRVGLEHGGRRHQHARRTDPALGGPVAQEGVLQWRRTGARQVSHGHHAAAGYLDCRRETRTHRLAVDQHCASPAVTGVTPDLDVTATTALAQHRAQPAARKDVGAHGSAVQPERDPAHASGPSSRVLTARRTMIVAAARR